MKRLILICFVQISIANAETDVVTLPEIEVTGTNDYLNNEPTSLANKIPTADIDVARSVTTITSKAISDQNALTMSDVMKNISNIGTGSNLAGNRSNYMMRGYVVDENNGTKIDGQYSVQLEDFDMFNVERVQVLKGVDGGTYGKSDPGGFVNIVTKKADWTNSIDVANSVGNFGYRKNSIAGNAVITDNIASRSVFSYSDSANPALNGNSEKERLFASQNFMVKLGQQTTFQLDFRHQNDNQNYGSSSQLPAIGNAPAPIDLRTNMSSPDDKFNVQDDSVGYILSSKFNELTFNQKFKFQSVNRLRQYLTPSALSNSGILSTKYTLNNQTRDTLTTDNSVTWGSALFGHKNNLIAGLDYVQENQKARDNSSASVYKIDIYAPNFSNFAWVGGPETDSFFTQKTGGIYTQDQLYLADNLILATGLRYNISMQSSSGYKDATDYGLNPNAGLTYKILPTVSLYTDYSQGFNPQSPTTTSPAPGGYIPPQRSQQTEFGLKWIDSKYGSFNASFFELLLDNVATTNPLNLAQNIYIGEARNMGVELDSSFKIINKISILANFSSINSKVLKDTLYAGNPLASVPNMTYGSWLMYDEQKYGMGLGFNHISSRAGDPANDFTLPAYTTLDSAAHYDITKNIRLQVNLKNITNEKYYSGSSTRYSIMQGQPFTLMTMLDIKFP